MKYILSDLQIDTGRQLVSRGANPIPLPKLSYDLLLAMVRATPNLVSLDELMRLVWPGVIVSPETVSQRVKLLRDALDDDPRVPRYIGGLRGRGYQIVAAVKEIDDSPAATAISASTPTAQDPSPARVAICVLPFANMSGDSEQEYFSDGITEDIITDLSKISALAVTSRNSAFVFKGRHVDVQKVARELMVSHVLEGSVRKAGGRVRITAQLVDGSSNDHVWAERYDRDLNDIFALQDEISAAIVEALKLRLLPEEKRAIARRGTEDAAAYNLYLMARQLYGTCNEGDARRAEAIIRLCIRATEIDRGYARAWALVALAQVILRHARGKVDDDGLAAAGRALELDANLAEAHAVKARILAESGRHAEASAEIDIALDLDSESYEVNRAAAYLCYRQQRFDDAIRYFEKATSLMETDINSAAMLLSCHVAVGDPQAARRSAHIVLSRTEKVLTRDPTNGVVTAYSAYALATLGEAERAKDRIDRAILIEPDNWNIRYNFSCALMIHLNDPDAAMDMLGPVLEKMAAGFIETVKADPDFTSLRDNPRFKAMIAAAEAHLAVENNGASPSRH